ncbi:MAG: N-acetylmuramoyl-L-alanine amidase [Anaerolineae bacterium]|nr:N-acetylmuramoyl-L-alanine amidase [Anaerolineae bacterium]
MPNNNTASDPWAVGWTIRVLVLIACFAALTVPTDILPIISARTGEPAAPVQEGGVFTIPLTEGTPESLPTPTPATPQVTRIGVIAGHTGSDSGAICPDGLQEVDINTDVARRVVALLTAHGWEADLLEEFDSRLAGYQAQALISIHADSCTYPGKTGFKVARAESGYVDRASERLVDCVSRYYQERTGLPFDAHTITYDMTRYHAYYEIDRNTPAAIIETGFMLDDRELLTQHPDIVAQGIVDGLICFVEGDWQ